MNDKRMEAINKLLYPKSVAVIGASNNEKKTGGRLMAYLTKHDFPYEIYPINPKETQIQGRACYQSIRDLPNNVDVALVVLPVKMIFSVMEECAAKGIKSLLIYSSGFAELGEEGEELQKNLVRKARELDVYICGPNAIGVANTQQNFFGSFSMAMETPNIPKPGKISFITQSGAIGGGLLSRVWSEGIGTSTFISSGNEADLDSADYIRFLADDNNTEVICVYLEGIRDGQKFIAALKKAYEKGKPVIVYKNGRTSLGKKSVQSHTGSLAGDFHVYEAVFKQYGVISVNHLEELFEVAKALLVMKEINGKNVGVLSTSGGACTIIADSCIQTGLSVPAFSQKTQAKLSELIPEYGIVQNPFDTTANIINDPKAFRVAMDTLIKDNEIDSIVLMLTTVGEPVASVVAQDIINLSKNTNKSIIITWLISETLAANAFQMLRNNGIPIFSSPERAITVLNYVTNYHLNKTKRLKERV
ncbi:acetate--CoA ligase family protein [Alkalihalobacterium alkalinitrilicum]|uniref:acetate--CoA ligase family protein n=1 Tax=Alkalihalobacterium alkalinitrilicum TaxID=427920 RepID=UPI000994F122|nr:CoA-binding protein [Alkalihalobacterium alkalinitrilicum]